MDAAAEMAASGPVDKSRGPYVCLSAHCDLLHFAGPAPHPYGGPTPQTVAERASRYVRFSPGEFPEKTPMVTVKCDHPLFAPVPVSATADGGPCFPLSGVALARRAVWENFDVSAPKFNAARQSHSEDIGQCHSPSQDEAARNLCETTTPLSSLQPPPQPPLHRPAQTPEAETRADTGEAPHCVVNLFALRRTLLQAVFVLTLPKRSPAVLFTLCAHDTRPCGVTSLSVLPRAAEKLTLLAHPAKVSLTVATTTTGDVLQCCCDCGHVEEEKGAACPSLLWEMNEGTETELFKGPLELNPFLTERMAPVLFALPEQLSRLEEGENLKVPQVIGWSQRRAFQFLALIAHCVWCEKVAWYITKQSRGAAVACRHRVARLEARNAASLDSSDKWETTLLFYDADDGDHHHRETTPFTGATAPRLRVTLRGCDEQMSWEWGGGTPRVSAGGLQDLAEAEWTLERDVRTTNR